MPTTRSRSRATKEPSVEELKEAIKGIYEELDSIYEGNKILVEALVEDIDSLSDWAERHSDFHKRVRGELFKPPTVWEEVCEVYSFVFRGLCVFLLFSCPLLLLVLLVFSIDFFVGYGIF